MNLIRSFSLLLSGFLLLTLGACKKEPQVEFKRTTNEVIVRIVGEPDRLNPLLSSNNYATQVNSQIFTYLLNVDPQTLKLIPQLAKSKAIIEEITEGPWKDGLAYTFEIHAEAVWDNGSPVTANDFVFTLKAALNPRVPAQRYRPYLAFIKDIAVDPANPKKFTVFTDQKYILGEEAIASTVPVIPEYFYDSEGLLRDIPLSEFTSSENSEKLAAEDAKLQQFADAFTAPKFSREKDGVSGCGPYSFESWETGQQIVLKKKENWWGDPLGKDFPALLALPDLLVFKPIPDEATSLAALKAEEIDVVSDIDPKEFSAIQQTDFTSARYEFHTPLTLANFFLHLNTRSPKLSDKLVRQALAHAINVPEIIEALYYGFGERTVGPVHPRAAYYNSDLKPREFNIEKARELLSAAGWEDTNNNGTVDKIIEGQLTELELNYKLTAGRELSQKLALLIQDNARRAGIGIALDAAEFTVIMDQAKKGQFEIISAGQTISPTLWDPVQSWHSQSVGSGSNYSGFGTAQTDALIEQIRVTLDEKQRNDMYKELQSVIYEEQPLTFLFVPTGRIAIHKRFETETSPYYPGFFPNRFRLKE